MNKLSIKQLSTLSAILGVLLGVLTLIPFVGQLAFIILMCFAAVIVIWFMLKVELIEIKTNKQSIVAGAIVGFISFIAFCVMYLPLVYVLSRVFNLYSWYGVSVFLSVGSFGIIILLVLFMALLSAVINAFTGFLTYYGLEFLKNIDNENK
ncbi:hypothetical protein J6E39_03580 [bacterium]|nr:hypothetical protein [bacterium]